MKLKRLIALLLVVIIPAALLFTGCGSKKQLTVQEYYDGLVNTYKEYSSVMKELSPIITGATSVEAVSANSAKAKEICGRADKALLKFKDLEPPSKYADQHKKLVKAIDNERGFVKAAEKLLTAKTLNDITSANAELKAFDSAPQDQQFATIFLQLIKDLKAELG